MNTIRYTYTVVSHTENIKTLKHMNRQTSTINVRHCVTTSLCLPVTTSVALFLSKWPGVVTLVAFNKRRTGQTQVDPSEKPNCEHIVENRLYSDH